MPLAALIAATREADTPGVPLRATYWLAGRTLIERQARLAAAAGARVIIVLVERIPAELIQAVERLRKEGLQVVTARNAREAAEAVSGGRLMLIADGFIGERSHVERLMCDPRPGLLAVTDRGFDERYERIDAETRWAGLGLIDADLLRDAAMMPDDWDLQSTLLRRALQTGVKPVLLESSGEAAGVAIVERQEDFAELQRRILEGAGSEAPNWLSRHVVGPAERLLTGLVMTSPVTSSMLGAGAVLLSALGAVAFLFDWRWAGLVPLLLATPLEGSAVRLARMRLQPLGRETWWRLTLPFCQAAALLALGQALMPAHGWGMMVLAAMAIVFLIALRHEIGGRKVPAAALLADVNSLILLLLPFALFGGWAEGVVFHFAYAAGSFFWAQFHVHRPQD